MKTTSLSTIALAASTAGMALILPPKKIPALGIQLYMVKEDMEKDAVGTLQKLGCMGYTK